MFKKPENNRMTVEEAERYGREINARSAQYENVEIPKEEIAMSFDEIPPPLSEEEIKKRVGEQNVKNVESDIMNSINS
ncbi:hypothetical protein [Sporosarcina sp. HYO08]|uniref:hypothetical protein n=1 Tax=Sporosarcina sp. HYO08 TaxID=1759557 RepID=UPI00079A7983|nr:hypothetical protein [Sporosarcina sp. HYO08]KXH86886.1 hypothetical protein AU377_13710 [Sporosarcina sp. HYO08]